MVDREERQRVTRLGDANPFERLGWVIAGVVAPPRPPRRPDRLPSVIAHRGAARESPENTLAAFRQAVKLGADGVEADVCVTRDGRWVLWHDADPDDHVALARQAGAEKLLYRPDGPGPGSPLRRKVRDLSLEELRAHYRYRVEEPEDRPATASALAEPPAAAAIELLDDLLEWAPSEPRVRHVYLDLKLAADQTAAAQDLVRLLRERAPDRRPITHLLSTQSEVVAALRGAAAEPPSTTLRVTPDFELPGVLEALSRLGLRDAGMGCGGRVWPAFRREVAQVVEARRRGALDAVVTWTVNGEKRLSEIVAYGVDAILTDELALLREIVRSAHPAGTVEPSSGAPASPARLRLPS
jgi:glycerophosphoryl diester phosphodiesterase